MAATPMTEISAKLVMQLRAATGLPMMKCSEALKANDGDFEKSIEWLRKKGLETAAKKADRVMKEGRVAIKVAPDSKSAVMVEVDCETEPVSGGPDFRALVDRVLNAAVSHLGAKGAGEVAGADVLAWTVGGESLDTTVKTLVAKIGENMAVRRAAGLAGGRVGMYLHHNSKVGVIAELAGPDAALASPDTAAFLTQLGMQIAASKPVAVSRDGFSKDVVDKELEIYREQAKQDPKLAAKPPAVLEKILVGKLEGFFKERALLEQEWVHDSSMNVKAALEATSKKAGGALSLKRFALFQVGA
jgi:elongation factor Ts